jgi:hypothetical protein
MYEKVPQDHGTIGMTGSPATALLSAAHQWPLHEHQVVLCKVARADALQISQRFPKIYALDKL